MALSILLSLLIIGNYYTQQWLKEGVHQLAAEHLILVSQAATDYVQEHYEQIGTQDELNSWKNEQKDKINKNKEYVPLSLEAWRYQKMQDYPKKEHLAEKNCYQQSYELYIADHLPSGKQLIVLSSEGQVIKPKALPMIARKADGSSGYIIPKKGDTIIDSPHGWELAVPARTPYSSGENQPDLSVDKIGPGHLARVQIINRVDTLNPENLLHRTSVPGKPELNQMETDLKMQQNKIIFENESITGDLSPQGLQFIQTGKKLTVGWNGEQQPEIKLHDDEKKQEILITAERITAINKEDKFFKEACICSYPELHAFWNKLPYYEMAAKNKNKDPTTEAFARKICSTSFDEKNSNQPLGRMFMIGRKNTKGQNKNYVYFCGATIDGDQKTPQAFRIFPKK